MQYSVKLIPCKLLKLLITYVKYLVKFCDYSILYYSIFALVLVLEGCHNSTITSTYSCITSFSTGFFFFLVKTFIVITSHFYLVALKLRL